MPVAADALAADALAAGGAALGVVIKPRDLAVTFRPVPYPLEQVAGTIRIDGGRVRLQDVSARHGDAKLTLAGTGTLGARSAWDLKLSAQDVPSDDLLRRALPKGVSELIDSLKLKGRLGFEFSRLVYRSPAGGGGGGADGAAGVQTVHLGAAAPEPEVDLSVLVSVREGSLEAGVELTQVEGRLSLDASVRGGRLSALGGTVAVDSMRMADRAVRDFRCELVKPADKGELRLDKMAGELAGGELAGSVKIVYPETGAGARYGADLVVRGADVRALVDEPESDLRGQVTASLSVEGAWDDPAARRGRGDVVASGREMYRIPLLLGLSQVTNLAVPVSSPFKEASARYSIQGQHIAFENIELRASNMLMTGEGHLDFGTKRVDLTFVTDNPRGLKVPFLNDIFQGARQELLKIHVRGTVEEPKVSAGLMGTFTTTVDEVFRGDAPAGRAKKKK